VDADYLTARIARDRPGILDRMKAGEYKSVRVAALAQRCTADASARPLFFQVVNPAARRDHPA